MISTTTIRYSDFKQKSMAALEYAESLKSKVSKTNELLSQGAVINGKGFNTDQFLENMRNIDTVCTNLNALVSYCSKATAPANNKAISGKADISPMHFTQTF